MAELSFRLVCPACRGPLQEISADCRKCPADGLELVRREGIWRCLTASAAVAAVRFLTDYRRLRADEGWGAEDAEYYRQLPFRDTTGRHVEIWRIRAASFQRLLDRVLTDDGLRIADLGAGNGWLARRLAESGHEVAAVDLSVDRRDGLGAASKLGEPRFLRLQAAFDELPLDDGDLDIALWNGSFHYSADFGRTLAEGLRVIRPGGRLVILDSPVYRRAASGEHMLRERREVWHERYGESFGTATAEPEGFLTRRGLRTLGRELGVRWRFYPLPLGWRWHLGPLAAVLRGRREPARFPLVVGQRTSDRPGRDDSVARARRA